MSINTDKFRYKYVVKCSAHGQILLYIIIIKIILLIIREIKSKI
jgi:hypothetical protein